ncbi:MAG TPA: bifunctional glutamate N-acetyltransferase/amino-acid acetyltransferase ArgJ [Candidatus Methylacidiphilales bacterium]|jgi:glutamate N-acetyltransferase/amino-acid N-acetyltransferase|nr:bifunctional glutamate N-acetyltransferase/amino-acid acetyltransferase ArgJ [Candidatus Methylacidiphilales bacterium]
MKTTKNMEAKTIKGGGVTSAEGFQAAGVACGIKPRGEKDMALIVSDVPAEAAAMFTTNTVKAAPVKVSMRHLRNGKMRGVVINSGCANACTGVGGIADAKTMVEHAAKESGTKPREWLVCSTGRIGNRLPMAQVRRGIEKAAAKLDAKNGAEAAKAIMTTDTRRKEFAMRFKVDGRKVTIGGMAKGAGMIHPKMATMLCVVTTDASIDRGALENCVAEAVEHSFNRISVDGDTSTNDTVIVMANGLSGTNLLKSYHPQFGLFKKTLAHVMRKLARMIVEDGEGITRVVDVAVKGAANDQEAKLAALAVAKSELIKTSWTGGDPNWGRIMAALGYSGARVREEMVEIFYDGLLAVANGQPSKTPQAKLRKLVRRPKFTITIHLHSGMGEYSILTTDLTEEYVRINKGE